jgi:transcription antitermination factor NusG
MVMGQISMNTSHPWVALQTKPKNEKKVDHLLRQKGYQCLTPTYRLKRRWSDRTVEVELPLFPGYVLCHLSSSALAKAISTQGVIRVVGFGGEPAEVAVEEVEALRLLARSNLLREPWTYLPQGTIVSIETGPLAGAEGIINVDGNKRRLVISVTLLQRSVAVHLDEDTVISVIADQGENRTKPDGDSHLAATLLKRA